MQETCFRSINYMHILQYSKTSVCSQGWVLWWGEARGQQERNSNRGLTFVFNPNFINLLYLQFKSCDTKITLQGDGLLTFLDKDIDITMRVLL